ncbi:unannotated protein [freshwater metagenome]|uniref:Unannotated protein n=1 Tax=freshwater metagenome TaxID=449393 RepID=A0A6J7QSQ8_9ZZZZ
MVAIAGANIAAPFAIPPTTAPLSPTAETASLRTVSVVSKALAAAVPPFRFAATNGMPVSITSIGIEYPIRPVEQTRKSLASRPYALPASSHMR